ncbi:MAG: response regulator [Pseudomonadota bacterium]|nr:MAG: response regulator [Pseudomonadota bacterium]
MNTTLLGVDDSKTMRKVLEITFAGENFRTVLAEDAESALAKLSSERPEVVLVDAALEGVNGYELCARVKATAPKTAVILLSSKHQPYDRNRGAEVGADDYIDKPFDTQQLIDKVHAALRKVASAAQAPVPQAAAPAPSPPLAAAPLPPVAEAPPVRPRAQTLAYGSQIPPAPAPATVVAPPSFEESPRVPPPVAPVESGARPPLAASGNGFGSLPDRLAGLGLTPEQVAGVLALSREVVEQVVWEVVPTLAETMIREEIKRLTSD